jgi:hypothetical protein
LRRDGEPGKIATHRACRRSFKESFEDQSARAFNAAQLNRVPAVATFASAADSIKPIVSCTAVTQPDSATYGAIRYRRTCDETLHCASHRDGAASPHHDCTSSRECIAATQTRRILLSQHRIAIMTALALSINETAIARR